MVCAGLALLISLGVASSGRSASVVTQVLPGWAGYAVRAGAGSFVEVRGRWVQPRIVCSRPDSAAAFWIGLGGATRDSQALEQVGTGADCSDRAEVSYSAWYQLWPERAVELPVVVRAGDVIDAAVEVTGAGVTVSFRNASTDVAVSKKIVMRDPEADSAEWIVEAPAVCLVKCTPLPLATFGRATFTEASATLGEHTGTISDPRWAPRRLTMGARHGKTVAAPSRLLAGGSFFAVMRSRH